MIDNGMKKTEQIWTILVTEDEDFTRSILAGILTEAGYRILEAANGREALACIEEGGQIDLLLTDINMPVMSGIELIQIVRQKLGDFPVVVLTGNQDISIAIDAIKNGAYDFLIKDENIEETVLISIRQVMEKEAIKRQNLQLLEHMAQKNQELEITLAALKVAHKESQDSQEKMIHAEKMASLGRLVAGVAHEINTPVGIGVTAISNLLELTDAIIRSFENQTMKKSDLATFLSKVKNSCTLVMEHLMRTSDLIRSFKMVSADQTSLEKRRFNLKAYMENILISLHPKLKKTHIVVKVDCSPDIEMDSYPGALAQIVTNFIINSLMHAYTEKSEGVVDLEICKKEENIIFVYRDDGHGIPEEHMGKIFDPFFTSKRGQGGTGLGLNIVFNTVTQKLGGTVHCTSQLGKGTEFTITMPSVAPG